MKKNKKMLFYPIKKPVLYLIILIFFTVNSSANNGERTKELSLVEGLEYKKITLKKGPVVIHQLRIDLSKQNLELSGSLAKGYLGLGLEKTTAMVMRENQKKEGVVAAVNADFFGGKRPVFQNCMILDGEFVKGVRMSRTLLMQDAIGDIHFNKYQFDGICILDKDTFVVAGLNVPVGDQDIYFYNRYYRKMPTQASPVGYWKIKPLTNSVIDSACNYLVLERFVNPDSLDFTSGYNYLGMMKPLYERYKSNDTLSIRLGISPKSNSPRFLIGGLPGLIEQGKRIVRFKNREGLTRKGFWKDRHPRTAVGIDRKNKFLYLLVVDGRQPGYSIGMKLKELGKYLQSLGCDEALNLDGGGSSSMVLGQKLINRPSDKKGERSVANSLLIRKR